MICRICQQRPRQDELRAGVCWDCANKAERIAANRSVLQHLQSAARNVFVTHCLEYVRFDLRWAWGRLTRSGDYKPGGYFEREGHFR